MTPIEAEGNGEADGGDEEDGALAEAAEAGANGVDRPEVRLDVILRLGAGLDDLGLAGAVGGELLEEVLAGNGAHVAERFHGGDDDLGFLVLELDEGDGFPQGAQGLSVFLLLLEGKKRGEFVGPLRLAEDIDRLDALVAIRIREGEHVEHAFHHGAERGGVVGGVELRGGDVEGFAFGVLERGVIEDENGGLLFVGVLFADD